MYFFEDGELHSLQFYDSFILKELLYYIMLTIFSGINLFILAHRKFSYMWAFENPMRTDDRNDEIFIHW